MTPWHTGRLLAFDTETTGVNYEEDRIVTAAAIAVGGDQPTVPTTWLIDPGIDIPAEAAEVHGITTEYARANGRKPAEVLEEIAVLLAGHLNMGAPVVTMNARFDFTLLDRDLRRNGLVPLVDRRADGAAWAVIDPLVIDKQVDKYRRGKRTLTALCQHYGVKLSDDDAHEASADALAAARVAYKLAVRFPELRRVAAEDVHEWQISWAQAQAESFQNYLRTKADPLQPDAVIEGAWPLVPHRPDGP